MQIYGLLERLGHPGTRRHNNEGGPCFLGPGDGLAGAVSRDIIRARNFEVGHDPRSKERTRLMHMQKARVWVTRWKICSTVFTRYWKTLTDHFLDIIGVICLILSTSISVEGDLNTMAAASVSWAGLILCLILNVACTSSTSSSTGNKSTKKNQDPCFVGCMAGLCFVVSGIEFYLSMVAGFPHITVCFCSWLSFLLISFSFYSL
jgi:hypothetical protein